MDRKLKSIWYANNINQPYCQEQDSTITKEEIVHQYFAIDMKCYYYGVIFCRNTVWSVPWPSTLSFEPE